MGDTFMGTYAGILPLTGGVSYVATLDDCKLLCLNNADCTFITFQMSITKCAQFGEVLEDQAQNSDPDFSLTPKIPVFQGWLIQFNSYSWYRSTLYCSTLDVDVAFVMSECACMSKSVSLRRVLYILWLFYLSAFQMSNTIPDTMAGNWPLPGGASLAFSLNDCKVLCLKNADCTFVTFQMSIKRCTQFGEVFDDQTQISRADFSLTLKEPVFEGELWTCTYTFTVWIAISLSIQTY